MSAQGSAGGTLPRRLTTWWYAVCVNRSEVLRRGMDSTGTSQAELSRLTGLPASKISRYVSGKLEPSSQPLTC